MKILKHTIYLGLLAMQFVSAAAQGNEPNIQFGLLADIQYADCEPRGSRYYRNSLPKTEEAVKTLNAQNVLFTINLGDIIDRDFTDIDSVLTRLRHLKNPLYNITGNHDYSGVSNNDDLYSKLNMPSGYYSFSIKEWTFVMLNTNEVASYANIAGTPLERELQAMLDSIKTRGGKNGYSYNGGISSRQLEWLAQTLRKADNSGSRVLIFLHHPPYPPHSENALNDLEILGVIGSYGCVKAVFAGHNHRGNFAYYKNIPVITAEGIVETADSNSFGIVKLYDNKIIIEGYGRMTSREFEIR